MFKRVRASTKPKLTQMLMAKASGVLPSNLTFPRVSSWNDLMKLKSFGEQSIKCNMLNRSSLMTMLKAFVRSIKAMKRGLCWSQHLPCSCLRENIISTVERWDGNNIEIRCRPSQ